MGKSDEDYVDLEYRDPDNPLNALTDRQRAFVEHYCATAGMNATESARRAGYSPDGAASAAGQNLRNLKILKALNWMAERKMTAAAYKATDVMMNLMDGIHPTGAPVSATEVRKVAERIQDFNGILAIRKSQVDLNINDNRKPEELVKNIYDLIDDIGGREAVALREKVKALGLPAPDDEPMDVEFEEVDNVEDWIIE